MKMKNLDLYSRAEADAIMSLDTALPRALRGKLQVAFGMTDPDYSLQCLQELISAHESEKAPLGSGD